MQGLVELARRKLDLVPKFARSLAWSVKYRDLFDDIQAYCFFLGYPRSGHSLVGQLLNAHPNAVVSHELHTLRYLRPGFSREQIYAMILERDAWFADRDRTWTGYSYDVEGAWQGTWTDLKVIGDKKGGATSNWLGQDPSKLATLRERVEDPLRAVHVVRNPFDNISTIARVGNISLEEATERYFRLVDTGRWARDELAEEERLDVRHEALIDDPETVLTGVAGFVGLSPVDEWVEACVDLLYDSPHQSRGKVGWSDDLVAEIEDRIETYSFLQGYAFDD